MTKAAALSAVQLSAIQRCADAEVESRIFTLKLDEPSAESTTSGLTETLSDADRCSPAETAAHDSTNRAVPRNILRLSHCIYSFVNKRPRACASLGRNRQSHVSLASGEHVRPFLVQFIEEPVGIELRLDVPVSHLGRGLIGSAFFGELLVIHLLCKIGLELLRAP